MRMAELARESGCTVATIKYYLRVGLLPAGEETAATQADYHPSHVARLRLIRVLREVGDVPISRIGEVLAAIDDRNRPLHQILGAAHYALGPQPGDASPALGAARQEMVAFVLGRGWEVEPVAPAFDLLASAVVALRRLGAKCSTVVFAPYADAAFHLAELELASIDPSRGPSDTVTQVIVGTVVYEQVLVALRRLAEEHYSNQRFGDRGAVGQGQGPAER